jgi:peptidoglycan/xylan/chitin deacetylase (PgdA/CDA1 family)
VALTFDDLPVHGPFPAGDTPHSVASAIIATLKREHVPAYGFVNAHWTQEQPETLQILEDWSGAGLSLGNHGWAHRHLSELTVSDFEEELTRNEPVLRSFAGRSDWHWFRYPFLDEGKDAAERDAARQVLARRGYKIADVTMDFGDWQWTAPYARCRAANDQQAIAQLEAMYLAAAREAMPYSRNLSNQLYDRDIPYVILLHESAFEARMLPQLIALFRAAGFRFVRLPHAERDPYYRDRVQPQLSAGPAGLVDHALAAGLRLPDRTDYANKLAALCQSGAAAPTVP